MNISCFVKLLEPTCTRGRFQEGFLTSLIENFKIGLLLSQFLFAEALFYFWVTFLDRLSFVTFSRNVLHFSSPVPLGNWLWSFCVQSFWVRKINEVDISFSVAKYCLQSLFCGNVCRLPAQSWRSWFVWLTDWLTERWQVQNIWVTCILILILFIQRFEWWGRVHEVGWGLDMNTASGFIDGDGADTC